MYVQRAKTDIGQISLAAGITSVVVWALQVFVVGELISRVEYLVGVHDLRALIEVTNRLLILTSVYVHHTAVQVVVLLVEDVLLVVVGLFRFFSIRFVITLVSALRRIGSRLKLAVELDDLIGIKVANILKLVLFLLVRRLLHAEPKIVALALAFFVGAVLLFTSSYCSDLVNFGTLCAWDHL